MPYVSRKYPTNSVEYLEARIAQLEMDIRFMRSQPSFLPLYDLDVNPPVLPANGSICMDYSEEGDPFYFYDLEWRPFVGYPSFEMKVFGDLQTVGAGNSKFVFMIPDDVDGMTLYRARAYVTTVSSSGAVNVMVRKNTANDMLSTALTIDSGEKNTYTAATPYVINLANATVVMGDEIHIDVDNAGTGAKGLGVVLGFK
jgi:hypothetical protein